MKDKLTQLSAEIYYLTQGENFRSEKFYKLLVAYKYKTPELECLPRIKTIINFDIDNKYLKGVYFPYLLRKITSKLPFHVMQELTNHKITKSFPADEVITKKLPLSIIIKYNLEIVYLTENNKNNILLMDKDCHESVIDEVVQNIIKKKGVIGCPIPKLCIQLNAKCLKYEYTFNTVIFEYILLLPAFSFVITLIVKNILRYNHPLFNMLETIDLLTLTFGVMCSGKFYRYLNSKIENLITNSPSTMYDWQIESHFDNNQLYDTIEEWLPRTLGYYEWIMPHSSLTFLCAVSSFFLGWKIRLEIGIVSAATCIFMYNLTKTEKAIITIVFDENSTREIIPSLKKSYEKFIFSETSPNIHSSYTGSKHEVSTKID